MGYEASDTDGNLCVLGLRYVETKTDGKNLEEYRQIVTEKLKREQEDMAGSLEENKNNRKAMNRNWSNQKPNPALKTKMGNK